MTLKACFGAGRLVLGQFCFWASCRTKSRFWFAYCHSESFAGPLRRFDFAGGAERERHQIVNATPPMLANNLTSDARKYKVLSIMFLLVATNNPRGLNNSGRARDKTRTLRLCLKRYQKQRASPKRVSAPTSHTGCVCYRMVAGQCFSRRLARRQQVLRHGASQKDLHDRHAPLFLSRERRKKAWILGCTPHRKTPVCGPKLMGFEARPHTSKPSQNPSIRTGFPHWDITMI